MAGRSLAQRGAEDLIALVQGFVWATFEDDVAFCIEGHNSGVLNDDGLRFPVHAKRSANGSMAPIPVCT